MADQRRPATEPPRYADRFVDQAAHADLLEAADGSDGDRGRRWPPWLVRTAAVAGVIGAAAIAITSNERPDSATDPVRTSSAQADTPFPDRSPAQADLGVVTVTVMPWESRGFTYRFLLHNPTDEPFEVMDVGPVMSGTELAWTRELVVPPGTDSTLRIDYLVVNCLAATTSAVPDEVRLVLRHGTAEGQVELARVPIVDQAAVIEAAGDDICAGDRASFDPAG